MKRLIPNPKDLGSVNWAQPAIGKGNIANTVMVLLSLLMVVSVFLPWFSWEYLAPISEETIKLESYTKLGITTLWGIFGFVVALVVLFGLLYKQYAATFWLSLVAALFGYFGTQYITGFEFNVNGDTYVVFEEELKMMQMRDELIPVTHVGANIFMILSVLVAALSLASLYRKEEESSCIAKVGLVVSAIIAAVICIDAALVTPTCLSIIAAKMLVWNLPLIAALIVVLALFKGEGKSFNYISVALLVTAFFFTNAAVIQEKNNTKLLNEAALVSDTYVMNHNADVIKSDSDYKALEKTLKKNVENAVEDEKKVESISRDYAIYYDMINSTPKGDSDYNEYDYYDEYYEYRR